MHPQIEAYLAQVKTQLKGLSAQQRSDEVRELGQHLQFLVEEGQGRGLSEGEAVRAALSQFGRHRKVGRDLNKALLRQAPQISKAFSDMTIIMIGGAVMGLLLSGVGVATGDGTLGGKSELWWSFIEGVFDSVVAIQIAVLLRRLRPWAFWLALVYLSHGWVCAIIGGFTGATDFSTFIALASVNPFTFAFAVLFMILFLSPSLFCLSVLVLNRKNYFRIASVNSSG